MKLYKLVIYVLFVFVDSCTINTIRNDQLETGDYLFTDSTSIYLEGKTLSYPVIITNSGIYEFSSSIYSNKAFNEKMKDTSLLDKSTRYPNDTLILETNIKHADSVLYQTIDTTTCSVGPSRWLFYMHTSKKDMPVNTPLKIELKVLRMDCQYPYDDIKYYTSLRRASIWK